MSQYYVYTSIASLVYSYFPVTTRGLDLFSGAQVSVSVVPSD